jgi:hypothetical protein
MDSVELAADDASTGAGGLALTCKTSESAM